MKIVAIIQARTGSTRLPNKVLMPLSGIPVVQHVVERVRASKRINGVVLATTTEKADDELEKVATALKINVFRGSQEDVLSRYYHAAKKEGANWIVRVTADCPLYDPEILDEMLYSLDEFTRQNQAVDYLSNTQQRTFPRGLDTEIFTFAALEKAYQNASKVSDKEHVTPYIYHNPQIFQIKSFTQKQDLSRHRWTLDTPEDYLLLTHIFDALGAKTKIFTTQDVLSFLSANPALVKINAQIEQKKVENK